MIRSGYMVIVVVEFLIRFKGDHGPTVCFVLGIFLGYMHVSRERTRDGNVGCVYRVKNSELGAQCVCGGDVEE